MEKFNVWQYRSVLRKYWKWIAFFVSATLLLSIVVNYGFRQNTVVKHYMERKITVSDNFIGKDNNPLNSLNDEMKNRLMRETANKLKISFFDTDVNIRKSGENSVTIDGSSYKEKNLEEYINALVVTVTDKIKEKYVVNIDVIIDKLSKTYKDKIVSPDGKVDPELIKKAIDSTPIPGDASVLQNEVNALTKAANEINKNIADKDTGIATINLNKNILQAKIDANENNLSELNARNDYIKSLEADGEQDRQYIREQELNYEQGIYLYNYNKSKYRNEMDSLNAQLKQLEDQKKVLQDQFNIQNTQLSEKNAQLNAVNGDYQKNIELYKELDAAIINNQKIDGEISITPVSKNKIMGLDLRYRAVIVSIWLAFILSCLVVILKEYYSEQVLKVLSWMKQNIFSKQLDT